MADTNLYVDSDSKLTALLASIATEPALALDTEFVREKTYYPKLCLIQIATPKLTACIDCLADIDLAPLFNRLFKADCTWVLHSARQDLEVMYQQGRQLPHELIDTQIAAALLGHTPQIGLQDLLSEELGVDLDKGFARSDWSRRPLPEAAVRYALDDVRYLLPLWQILAQKLNVLQRGDWLTSDCVAVLNTPPVTPPLTLWTRLRGLRSMDPQRQCAALALVTWRERYAQSLDQPRRWIMSDELLLRIAKSLPENLESLQAVDEMPRRLANRSGHELLAALQDSDGADQRMLIETHLPPKRPEKRELQTLHERVRARAGELGLHNEVLATRREIGEFLVGRTSGRIDSGWRQAELQCLLADHPENGQ
ncbi:MAG: HRDC domain-containing protein [Gammaproteobacteria bacterium]|nr:HRDC domain-containing protein [Gammaproteobacteria bacterium]